MQRCVLLPFLNNDTEMVSAVLQIAEAHAITLQMLWTAARWAEDEKGNRWRGSSESDCVSFLTL